MQSILLQMEVVNLVMKSKLFLGIIMLVVLGGAAVFFTNKSEEQIACTMEAKLCPDGSYIGRVGPKCEFAECPVSENGGGNSILPYNSGIQGVVLRGPMCPVVRLGEECGDAPYETEVVVSRATPYKVFATMKSDRDGKFLINLPPGDYLVSASNEGISKTCDTVSVTVSPEELKNITISCDTGIR